MKSNKTLLWVGIGSALLIGGGLFWWFKNKPKTDENKEPVKEPVKETEKEPVKPVKEETFREPVNDAPTLPPSTPFKNKTEGNAFRVWVSINHPEFRYKNDTLGKSGEYNNDFMRVAYDKYKKEYTYKPYTNILMNPNLSFVKNDSLSSLSANGADGFSLENGNSLGKFRKITFDSDLGSGSFVGQATAGTGLGFGQIKAKFKYNEWSKSPKLLSAEELFLQGKY